ncbi:hypothetical protein EDD85DRAFT_330546 [Armillaria nabsnona]|nr:hypothetical protein EDD85DRAFT_330546 [Armillaria nabsnona]
MLLQGEDDRTWQLRSLRCWVATLTGQHITPRAAIQFLFDWGSHFFQPVKSQCSTRNFHLWRTASFYCYFLFITMIDIESRDNNVFSLAKNPQNGKTCSLVPYIAICTRMGRPLLTSRCSGLSEPCRQEMVFRMVFFPSFFRRVMIRYFTVFHVTRMIHRAST